MKKSTRLTALLLALLLLLASLSASATENENVLTMDGLVLNDYFGLVSDAESVGLRISEECGSLNPYCASANKLIGMTSAQARYDYLAAMTSVDAANVLLHYDLKHADANALCLCAYPYFDAAYVPGGSNHEADCPWSAANYVAQQEDSGDETACSPATCTYRDELGSEFFSMDTFHQYEVLNRRYNEIMNDEDAVSKFKSMLLHLRSRHVADGAFCLCSSLNEVLSIFDANWNIGLNVHGESCPWNFKALTTEEQAYVLEGIDSSEHNSYIEMLESDQQDALNAFRSNIGKQSATLSTADAGVSVQISVPTGAFSGSYVLQAENAQLVVEMENVLKAAAEGHTLAAFDIQFLNLSRPGELLTAGSDVSLEFSIDASKVEGSTAQVYRLVKGENGAYAATAIGEPVAISGGVQTITVKTTDSAIFAVRFSCDGADCGYNEFKNKTGFERETYLEGLLTGDDEAAYDNFVGHINGYHYEDKPAHCICADYKTNYANLGYGSINHGKDPLTGDNCPWHFAELSTADEYQVYLKLKDEATREAYIAALDSIGTKQYDLLKMIYENEPPKVEAPELDLESDKIVLTFDPYGATSYQWYQSADNGQTWTKLEGENKSTLELNVSEDTKALGYVYQCVVTLDIGLTGKSETFGLIEQDMREWVMDNTAIPMERIILMKAAMARGVTMQQAIGLAQSGELLGLYEGETLAIAVVAEDRKTYLIDTRYHIPVAEVDEDGAIIKLATDTTGGDAE